ncbi:MAG: ThuA domain-containing protein [Acidobacteria bacterium]|nr:ThuA domain-containing protein [Acidobacteriota bacterium]
MNSLQRQAPATRLVLVFAVCSLLGASGLLSQAQPPQRPPQGPPGAGPQRGGPRQQQGPARKQVLLWGELTGGGAYHEGVNNAMAVLYRLGRETGLYDAYIRTDPQFVTKQKLVVNADGRDWPVSKNLDSFDAVFFYGQREIPLTQQQMTDLISFVKDDGKGFVAAHTAFNAFARFPEFGDMLGARYDGHPWGQAEATVTVLDSGFPGMKEFPLAFTFRDEFIQVKDFSWESSRVLMTLDTSKLDMTNPNVHRAANDFPQAWARTYGKGRVFVSGFGHSSATWDRLDIQRMWLEAIKWATGQTQADATPRPKPAAKAGQ